jgi:hypothetical protein
MRVATGRGAPRPCGEAKCAATTDMRR